MAAIQNLESMESQVQEIKAEKTKCKTRTLKNLDKLHALLNGQQENSEEEAVVVPEPAAQV